MLKDSDYDNDSSIKTEDLDNIVYEGFMKQKINSHFLGSKTKRYFFRIEEKKLKKFDDSNDEFLEDYDLSNYTILDGSFITSKKLTILFIHNITNIKTYFFCDIEYEFKQWLKFLTKINDKLNDNNSDIFTLESILEPCIIGDNFGVILGFNSEAEKMFGYSKNELIGKNVNILMPDSYAKIHDNYLENYRKTDQTRLIGKPRSLPIKCKNGTIIYVIISLGRSRQKGRKEILITTFKYANDSNNHTISIGNINEIELKKINLFGKLNENNDNIIKEIKTDYDFFINLIKNEQDNIKILQDENNRLNDKISDLYKQIQSFQNNAQSSDNYNKMTLIMKNDVTFKAFLEFAKQKKNEENLLFWKSVHDMKADYDKSKNNDNLYKDVCKIFNTFVFTEKLNIHKLLIDNVKKLIDDKHISHSIFDVIIKDINVLIYENLYIDFISTGIGKVCLNNISI